MRILREKIYIKLVISLIRIITILKRSFVFLFLVFLHLLIKISKALLLPPLLFLYKKIYFPSKKGLKILFRESSKNKFFYFLSYPKSINILIILISIFVAINNISGHSNEQNNIQKSPLFVILSGEEEITEEALLEENTPLENYFNNLGAIKPSLQVGGNEEEAEITNLVCFFDYSFLFKPFTSLTYQTPRSRTKIETYIVRSGDTISDIAEKFGLWTSTILWENNLSSYSVIKPGQELTVLPVNGVTHKIKKGDILDSIAKKYKAKKEEILEFNNLMSEKNLETGLVLMIPNGQKYVAPTIKQTIPQQAYQFVKGLFKSHIFPWGQCTWYIAQRRLIPWGGNAKNWIASARAYGYKIGITPAVGAIVSLKDSGWQARLWGHVAYVEEVKNGQIIISEMNYKGRGVYSKRVLSINDKKIIGYIY